MAIYGAALSTVAIVWNVFRDLRNKGRLKVKIMIDRQDSIFAPNKAFLSATITNVGSRPIMVTGWGWRGPTPESRKDEFILRARVLPRMLAPSEYVIECSEDLSVLGDCIHYICAWDSTGKAWRASRESRRDARKELANLLKTEKLAPS